MARFVDHRHVMMMPMCAQQVAAALFRVSRGP